MEPLPHTFHVVDKATELDEGSHETLSDEILLLIILLMVANCISIYFKRDVPD